MNDSNLPRSNAARTTYEGAPATGHAPATTYEAGGASATTYEGGAPGTVYEGRAPGTIHDGAPDASGAGSASGAYQRIALPTPLRAVYEYLRDLASSGQADIILARDRSTGAEVAIKIYRSVESGVDEATMANLRGQRPAEAAAHVVPILDSGTDGHRMWEVMEYFPRGELGDYVARVGQGKLLPPRMVKSVLHELVIAIDYIHSIGVIHRDLKPANILVRTDEPFDAVLTDFGYARTKLMSRMVGSRAGTEPYQAPEAARRTTAISNDWWALGAIVHELLTGEPPALDPFEVVHKVAQGTWTFDHIPDPRWRAVTEGLLTPEADDRWGSAQVHDWLNGRDPEVIRRAAPTAPQERVVGTFFYRGREHETPASLAAALGEDWQDAADFLVSRRLADLRTWLGKTSIGSTADDLMANIRDGATSPQRGAVELQAMLDPGLLPSFMGVTLDATGFEQVLQACDNAEEWAITWVRELRREAILSVVGQHGWTQFARAGDQVARWWRDLSGTRQPLEANAEIEPLIGASENAIEGALLRSALDPSIVARFRQDSWEKLTGADWDYPEALRQVDQASLPQILRARVIAEQINSVRTARRLQDQAVAAEQRAQVAEQAALQRRQQALVARRARAEERRRARQDAQGRIGARAGVGAAAMAIAVLVHVFAFGYPLVDSAITVLIPLAIGVVACFLADWLIPRASVGSAGQAAALVTAMAALHALLLQMRTGSGNLQTYAMLPIWCALAYCCGMVVSALIRVRDVEGRETPGWLHVLPTGAVAVMIGAFVLGVWSVDYAGLSAMAPPWIQAVLNPLEWSLGFPIDSTVGNLAVFAVGWAVLLGWAFDHDLRRLPSAVTWTFWIVANVAAGAVLLAGMPLLTLGLAVLALHIVPFGILAFALSE